MELRSHKHTLKLHNNQSFSCLHISNVEIFDIKKFLWLHVHSRDSIAARGYLSKIETLGYSTIYPRNISKKSATI